MFDKTSMILEIIMFLLSDLTPQPPGRGSRTVRIWCFEQLKKSKNMDKLSQIIDRAIVPPFRGRRGLVDRRKNV
jgi:hypothetical protein